MFAAAVAAPWGTSEGFIISKASRRLAHAVMSPRRAHENCHLIVPGSSQAKVADGVGKTVKKWTKHVTVLPKKAASCVLASSVPAFQQCLS